ncbi:MFS general substrate transporter [Daedalea quercina L-15889]|uniref:MFS general substrate transporter n=1 Tax=Daedalea quercina L-15889 TaxID=1314783 RepID=A0A165PL11_9APHY|nr:MFS general substrate transporter [Daedalea quercina L-15889]
MAIAASAAGLISDGYHNNLMTMTNVVFKKLYPTEYTSDVSTRVSNALLVGEVIGQIIVGILCDRVGRKAGLVMTTLLIIIGAVLCTVARGAHGSVQGLFWFMTVARGIVGVGAGGEYPASSTSASEGANEVIAHQRGAVFIMVTDFPLAVGGPLVVSIFLIVLSAAGESHLSTVWRVCFGIGIILPLAVFYFRMRMITSKLYREGAIKRRVPYRLALRRYWKSLIGTAGTWFLYDFIDYPNGIFSATIIANVIKDGDIKKTAEWQLLLGAIALPGVVVGAFLCNPLGRRYTMMLGFSGYVIFGLIIGCAYDRVTSIVSALVILYGLMIFMSNLGPGNITLLAAAESYPTAIRGTFFGISAAMGKVGAAVGTQIFIPIQNSLGKRWTFIIAAIFGAVGMLLTYVFVPDMTGVDLTVEDEKFFSYLAENGWEGDIGEEDTDSLPIEDIDGSSIKDVTL